VAHEQRLSVARRDFGDEDLEAGIPSLFASATFARSEPASTRSIHPSSSVAGFCAVTASARILRSCAPPKRAWSAS
jgi:hypothetical protein